MEGKQMSLYGKRDIGPGEETGSWKAIVRRSMKIANEHLANKDNNPSAWKAARQCSDGSIGDLISYYGARRKTTEAEVSTNYERLFHNYPGYNSKLHRDDRKNILTIGISVNMEEEKRPFPVLSSSEYGRRLNSPLEPFQRNRTRIDHVLKGFYYRTGTGLPPVTE